MAELSRIKRHMLDKEVRDELDGHASQLAQFASITSILNVKNDGTQDISTPLLDYANGKEEIHLYFPQGTYKWDNYVKLTNKKIKFVGDNAVIEHYSSGTNLEIGDASTKNTEFFSIEGIDFVNKKPKPATNGTGVTALLVGDCVKTVIRDVNVYDAEQYGINLRRENGNLQEVILDNTNVYRCAGNLSTTTSIALETRANSGDGKIGTIKITNSYFEVTDKFINDQGATSTVTLSNASKLQACDNVEIVNTTFSGGKENGPLSFIYDTKKVSLVNVKLVSPYPASKGLTISNCLDLDLTAVNCDLGTNNFTQSLGLNGTVKKAKFTNCKVQRITVITGSPENFEFNNCDFELTSALNITLNKSVFNNCTVSPNSTSKDVFLIGSDNKLNNFNGVGILEIHGNNNEIKGGTCTDLRPTQNAKNGVVDGIEVTSQDRALHFMSATTEGFVIKNSRFKRLAGSGSGQIGYVQGAKHKIQYCDFIQVDKTGQISYPVAVINTTDCELIEKENYFDANSVATYNINATQSTGFKQYNAGDTFVKNSVPQMWNGTAFVNLTTA